jgi:hypothetical protein
VPPSPSFVSLRGFVVSRTSARPFPVAGLVSPQPGGSEAAFRPCPSPLGGVVGGDGGRIGGGHFPELVQEPSLLAPPLPPGANPPHLLLGPRPRRFEQSRQSERRANDRLQEMEPLGPPRLRAVEPFCVAASYLIG